MQEALFNLSSLSALLALLITLSVAAERLVEIIKNIPVLGQWLKTDNPDASQEGLRRLMLQLLAVGTGVLTAWLALEVLPTIPGTGVNGKETSKGALTVLGLLASGGSGFWTSILGYVNNIKEIKKAEAVDTKVRAAANVAAIARGTATPVTALREGMRQQSSVVVVNEPASQTAQDDANANLEQVIKIANATL